MDYRIDHFWAGKDIKTYLRKCHGYSSRSLTKLRKVPDGILKNGVHARTIDILQAGDRLHINFPTEENVLIPSEIPVPIVYEDDWILVYNKPPFMASHTTKAIKEDTLANVYAAHCQKSGVFAPFRPIGRLDRNTSGLMVVAKNRHAATVLQHHVTKEYYGFGCGKMPNSEGIIEAAIGRPDENSTKRLVMEDGQYAKTAYTCYGNFGSYCFCSFRLYTGRTHQIRTHMEYMGAPLAGDELYGGSMEHIQRHALHCGRVEFVHPKTGRHTVFTAPLPEDMRVFFKMEYTK